MVNASQLLKPLREVLKTGRLSHSVPEAPPREFDVLVKCTRAIEEQIDPALLSERDRLVHWAADVEKWLGSCTDRTLLANDAKAGVTAAEKAGSLAIPRGRSQEEIASLIRLFRNQGDISRCLEIAAKLAKCNDRPKLLRELAFVSLPPTKAASNFIDIVGTTLRDSRDRLKKTVDDLVGGAECEQAAKAARTELEQLQVALAAITRKEDDE